MKKNEIIKLLKPKCNGYDLPLSLNIELIAELLVNKQEEDINYTRCYTQLQAVEDLKEFARNNCREWNAKEMEQIIDRL
jgi:hypothetical protein